MVKFRIKQVCKERGIPLKTLAEMLDSSPSSLSQMIGGGGMSLKMLERIAKCLDMDVADLIERENPNDDEIIQGCVAFRNKVHLISSVQDLEKVMRLVKGR